MLYRYETIDAGDMQTLNRLLSKGWRPVRESPLAEQRLVVLLEREGGATGNAVINGVNVADLADIPLLAGLTEAELDEVLAASDVVAYQPEDVVFSDGEESGALYIVLEGEVSISLLGDGEEAMEISEIGPQSAFGESSFFAQGHHSGTAQCVQAARILQLRRDDYQALSNAGSTAALKVAENAAESLSRALRTANEWILELLNEQASGEAALSWQRFRNRIRHGHFG